MQSKPELGLPCCKAEEGAWRGRLCVLRRGRGRGRGPKSSLMSETANSVVSGDSRRWYRDAMMITLGPLRRQRGKVAVWIAVWWPSWHPQFMQVDSHRVRSGCPGARQHDGYLAIARRRQAAFPSDLGDGSSPYPE